MRARTDRKRERRDEAKGTLGDVLYGGGLPAPEPEREWVALVRAVANGDEAALHALYERTSRPVYTLMVRIHGDRATAEELTLDVFHDIWRRADRYDPVNGTVLGWIMNQARSRAIDRLRHDGRKKRTAPTDEERNVVADAGPEALFEKKSMNHSVRGALGALNRAEREVIEVAFFSELSHAEVAKKLKQPLGTVKARIRSGLHKLRKVLGDEVSS